MIKLLITIKLTHREDYHGLMPAWLSLDNVREQEYIWEILSQDDIQGLSVPILLCPDDMDLSCTIIVAKVFYTHDGYISIFNAGDTNGISYKIEC